MKKPELIYPKTPLHRAIPDYLVEFFMVLAPHDPFSCALKRVLLRWRGATVGNRVKIWRDVMVDDYRKLSIGDNVTIGRSTLLVTLGGVTIGNDVMVSYACKIISASHRIPARDESLRTSGVEVESIVIEDDSWIGASAIILPGVTIGRGSVVAAGAVVTRDVPRYAVVAGVPANVLRYR